MSSDRDKQITVRLTADEMERFRQAADDAGLSLSQWIRLVCRDRVGLKIL